MGGVEGEAEVLPVVAHDQSDVFGVQASVLVDEADAAVQLGVAGESPFEAGGMPIRTVPTPASTTSPHPGSLPARSLSVVGSRVTGHPFALSAPAINYGARTDGLC